MPVLKQDFVKDAEPTPQIAIDTYMAALGFNRQKTVGRYSNADYTVWDLIPRNVLRDRDGDIFVVDAEVKLYSLHPKLITEGEPKGVVSPSFVQILVITEVTESDVVA